MNQVLTKNQEIIGNKSEGMIKEPSLEDIQTMEGFLDIPSQMFSPYRIMIMSALWRWYALDFKALRGDIKIKSDSNLIGHLKVLEKLDLIEVKKEFDNKIPRTFYKLTENGSKTLKKFILILEKSLGEIGGIK